MNRQLTGENRPVQDLGDREQAELLTLMRGCYDNIQPEKFLADLREKEAVVLIRENGRICGFTTWKLIRADLAGQSYTALFSGDTVVEEQFWGQTPLITIFAGIMIDRLAACETPLYWFLLSKGIRTFLMLPLFFKRYFPAPSDGRDSLEARLVALLARDRYGESYLPEEGIVRLRSGTDRLKPRLAVIETHRLEQSRVREFLRRNPGYREGDELVCLARIDWDNFTRSMLRLVGKTDE